MIVVRLKGGMGNQMFQYACGRALAIKNNTSLLLDTTFYKNPGLPFREYDLDVFNIDEHFAQPKDIPLLYSITGSNIYARLITKIYKMFSSNKGIEKSFAFDPSVTLLGPDAYLDGYWQSIKYFSGYEDVIRKDFALKVVLSDEVQRFGQEIRSCNSVCVHIRRADYVGNSSYDVGIGQQYCEKGVKEIARTVNIERVYVFSDDIEWCRENLSFEYETIFTDEKYSGVKQTGHFWLMQQCKHFVSSNSSYSWWAAWLAVNPEKKVVAPKKWFNNASIDDKDIVPEEWIQI